MKNYKKVICLLTLLHKHPDVHGMSAWKKISPESKLAGLQLGITVPFLMLPSSRIEKVIGMGALATGILNLYFLNFGRSGYDLFSLAAKGDTRRAVLAIALGSDLNDQDAVGNTPLIYAVINKHLAMVQLLIGRGAQPNIQNSEGLDALVYAVRENNIPIARYLLRHGANPQVRLPGMYDNRTLLHQAARDGTPDMIDILLSYGLDINAQDDDGNTPLMRASWWNRLAMVQHLLEKGADTAIKRNDGQTAEDIARQAPPEETAILKVFEEYRQKFKKIHEEVQGEYPAGVANVLGAYFGNPKEDLDELLAKAAFAGDAHTIKALIAQGARIDKDFTVQREDGIYTGIPVEWAVANGHFDAAKELLAHSLLDDQQKALSMAAALGQAEILELLLHNPELTIDSRMDGFTNLMLAVQGNRDNNLYAGPDIQQDYPHVIKLLLQAGASTEARNPQGQTVREMARELGSQAVLKVFEEFDRLNQNLFAAIKADELKQVAALVEQGARFDARDEEGNTPLIIAAGKGFDDSIDFLLQQARIEAQKRISWKKERFLNAQNNYGTTALIWAVMNNKPNAIRTLLQVGADPKIVDMQGRNVFNYARNNFPIMFILLRQANLQQAQPAQ